MAKQGYKVFDSDMHVVEPPDLWQRYIDPAYRATAPVGTKVRFRDIGLLVDGAPVSKNPQSRWKAALEAHMAEWNPYYAFAEERGWDGASQVQAMDMEGIDVAVLYPSRGLFVLGLDSTETVTERGMAPNRAAAIARAYNDWMRDLCSAGPARMYGAGMVAPHDIESAVSETRRCVEDLGFKAIFLLPGRVNNRGWHDPYYDPLWAECQRLNIPVGFHGGGGDFLTPDFGLAQRELFMVWHAFSHSLGPMSAMAIMTAGGVFERFPKLQAGFLEANCSWAPWLLYRQDDHYEDYIGRFENPLRMKPSEYFQRNRYVSVESDEVTVKSYVDFLGDDNVVFSTDYPHPDSKFPHATERFLKLALSKDTKRKFLWDNCARLYNLDSLPKSPPPRGGRAKVGVEQSAPANGSEAKAVGRRAR